MDLIYLNLLKLQAQNHNVTVVTLCRSNNERGHRDQLVGLCDEVIVVTPAHLNSLAWKIYRRLAYTVLSFLFWRPNCTFYGAPKELSDEIRRLTTENSFDLVEIHHSTSASLRQHVNCGACALYLYDVHFRAKGRLAATKKGLSRLAAKIETSKFHNFETHAIRKFDLLLMGQEQDKVVVENIVGPSVAVALMPNVIDTDEFRPDSKQKNAGRVAIFVGAMTHQPNVDAILYFFEAVWKNIAKRMPGVEWWIVGASPPKEITNLNGHFGVRVFANVPDVRPYFSDSSVYIAPLRIGSGVKVKIIEALALGKAIVATGIASEGMGLVAGRDIEVAELDKPFEEAVVRIFNDEALRVRLEQNGRRAAVELFGVQAGLKTLAEAFSKLPGGVPPKSW